MAKRRLEGSMLSIDRETLVQLLEGVRKGEQAACRALYLACRPSVVRLLEGFATLDGDEREDVVQEVFVRAFRAVGDLKRPDAFEAWLLSIARNRGVSALARKSSQRDAHHRFGSEQTSVAELIPEAVNAELAVSLTRRVIESLPEGPEKQTVQLFYVEGQLSAREIAERLGVSKSAVTMRLDRFRQRVKRTLVLEVLRKRWSP